MKISTNRGITRLDFRHCASAVDVQSMFQQAVKPRTRWWRFDLQVGRLALYWSTQIHLLPAVTIVRYDQGSAWAACWLWHGLVRSPFPLQKAES